MGPVQIPEAARREKRKACLLRSATEVYKQEREGGVLKKIVRNNTSIKGKHTWDSGQHLKRR